MIVKCKEKVKPLFNHRIEEEDKMQMSIWCKENVIDDGKQGDVHFRLRESGGPKPYSCKVSVC